MTLRESWYLRVVHTVPFVIGMLPLGTPAAGLLRHLLGACRHPGLALCHPPIHWPEKDEQLHLSPHNLIHSGQIYVDPPFQPFHRRTVKLACLCSIQIIYTFAVEGL